MGIFDTIYAQQAWGCGSGPGSQPDRTDPLREPILRLLRRTVLDVGCGMSDWLERIVNEAGGIYVGVDVAQAVCDARNVARVDLTRERMVADIAVCRDVLTHLSFADAQSVLSNLLSPRLLLTHWPGVENVDIETGGWRPLNMEAEPFGLRPVATIMEVDEGKTLALFDRGYDSIANRCGSAPSHRHTGGTDENSFSP